MTHVQEETGPTKVAIIGTGCAAITTAFELTRPQHQGRYQVTIYQTGWRAGGKGASGRGPAGRIEEHGLHVWLGFYENAFRLLRECYAELGRDKASCPIADWRQAFFEEAHVGVMAPATKGEKAEKGGWVRWSAMFPPSPGLPGDPISQHNPFTLTSYLGHLGRLLRALLLDLRTHEGAAAAPPMRILPVPAEPPAQTVVEKLADTLRQALRLGALAAATVLIEAAALVEVVVAALPRYSDNALLRLFGGMAGLVRQQLEGAVALDEPTRGKWEILDLVLAILVGCVRHRLILEPRGLEALDQYECRDWLRMNGASDRSLNGAFIRGLYDLALAYEDGDPRRPGLAAGQALRGSLRMFFTYRGAMFWKMRAGMGDVVFAPFYEVLKKRGVVFKFFHRLENVGIAEPSGPGGKPHVSHLDIDVQADVLRGAEYQPLVDIKGLPCWPAEPDWAQLKYGKRLRSEGWQFESHWDTRAQRRIRLEVGRDFDFVVLGLSVGSVPHTCSEILARDERWRRMCEQVKTVPTQALQLWLSEDMAQLGFAEAPITLSAFVKPFDTWADMRHVLPAEDWAATPCTPSAPKAVAYFCNVLADTPAPPREDREYPARRRAEVQANAERFLQQHVRHLWPKAMAGEGAEASFRWELLCAACDEPAQGPTRLTSQYLAANINPSDRYVLALPGSLRHRISPLDSSYDNLTICGDWTDCGFNEGCVEAAVMSGRLAAHALSLSPKLEEIIGYDHP